MKIIQIFIFFHLVLISSFCCGQYSFEYKKVGSNNEGLFYTFENSSSNYISVGGGNSQWGVEDPTSALIVRNWKQEM
ncbi:MAG: hypothetical protein R2764_16010 [Bacteroidales bacterium]